MRCCSLRAHGRLWFCRLCCPFYLLLCTQRSYLVSVQGAGQDKLGIYVKSVVKGGAADVVSMAAKEAGFWCPVLDGWDGVLCAGVPGRAGLGGIGGTASLLTLLLFSLNVFAHRVGGQDGRLAAGDQLLSVDGRSLVGLSQERYDPWVVWKLSMSIFM